LTEGHDIGGVVVVGDATAQSEAREALQAAGVPFDKIHGTSADSVLADGRRLVDKAIESLPQRETLAANGFAGVKFPVISPAAGQWTAQDPRLQAATVLLQILGDKLLRISLDAAESIRQEALRLSHA
jgi:hypothetical protein